MKSINITLYMNTKITTTIKSKSTNTHKWYNNQKQTQKLLVLNKKKMFHERACVAFCHSELSNLIDKKMKKNKQTFIKCK